MGKLATLVEMPKAAVHKDNFFLFCKYYIWATGQTSHMKPVPVPKTMEEPANY